MNDLKELVRLFRDDPRLMAVTLVAMAIGAALGAVAFYQGWLG